jgi:ElaB/YqjD/DUF883 family membrane-anchored ribosome-binding protein
MAIPIPADMMKTIRQTADDISDLRDDVVHKVRKEPMKLIGIAVGAGVVLGALTGLACYAGFARLCSNGRSR